MSKGNDALKSFAMGFLSMKGVELEQPIFGANYLKGIVVAEPTGKWTGEIMSLLLLLLLWSLLPVFVAAAAAMTECFVDGTNG